MTYPAAKSPAEHRLLGYGFGLTVFLSAFLLFQVQPIISKVLLPWFGGSPSVWTTCMLVFQWLLFAGYAYAHLATRRLSARGQTILHVAILVAAATLLPILPGAGWKPTSPDHPWLSVVSILLGCVGLPFFVLSTSGPLLQAWFARTFPGQSPYRLYALSNAGSLLGLITYPFVVEPWLPLARQSMDWSGLFVAYAVFCGTVSIKSVASRSREPAAPVQQFGKAKKAAPQPQPVRPTARLVALWFALGAVPSIMMLATTNQVCGDVAPAPFLWIVPLSLYLLSFILCFESTRWYRRRGYLAAFAVSGGAMAYVLGYTTVMPIAVQVTVYFSGVFLCAMLCHGELNRLKPDPEHLTFFYLVLAAAGATGGAVVSLVAPLVFHSYLEFPLAVVATFALGLGIAYRDQIAARATFRPSWDWCLVLAAALGTAGGMGYCVVQEQHNSIRSLRNFYGVLRVVETPVTRRFSHGRTLHGLQLTDSPAARRTGTTYFGPRSGIGLVLQFHNSQRARRIGVVGLGAGTLAVYAKAGDSLRFYELDPDVLRLASQYFTFLSDCPARVDTVLGDARLALEAERQQTPTQPYDVLAVDAFSGDAIPMHLLTREAVALYLGLLKDDGILAFHVSNRHFDLTPVLAAAAKSERLVSRVVIAQPTQSAHPERIANRRLDRRLLQPGGRAPAAANRVDSHGVADFAGRPGVQAVSGSGRRRDGPQRPELGRRSLAPGPAHQLARRRRLVLPGQRDAAERKDRRCDPLLPGGDQHRRFLHLRPRQPGRPAGAYRPGAGGAASPRSRSTRPSQSPGPRHPGHAPGPAREVRRSDRALRASVDPRSPHGKRPQEHRHRAPSQSSRVTP
jgi:hypothetical protein